MKTFPIRLSFYLFACLTLSAANSHGQTRVYPRWFHVWLPTTNPHSNDEAFLSDEEIQQRRNAAVEEMVRASDAINQSCLGRIFDALRGVDIRLSKEGQQGREALAVKAATPEAAAAIRRTISEESMKRFRQRKSGLLKQLREYLTQYPDGNAGAYPGPFTRAYVQRFLASQEPD